MLCPSAARLVSASVTSRPLASSAPTRAPAEVPTIALAPARSTPASLQPDEQTGLPTDTDGAAASEDEGACW